MPNHQLKQVATTTLPDLVRNFLDQRLETRTFDLPMLPQVVTQVMALCNSSDAEPSQLAELIHSDQAIAGHVLRVVNSPMFGGHTRIVSLQQAVSRLGMRSLGEIVVAVAVRSRLFTSSRQIDVLRQLWRHSVACAILSKEIARMRRRNVESLFLCGLMHDVGKTVVLDAIGQLETEIKMPLPEPHLFLAMDAYHARVGGLLAKEWNLPDPVVESVLFHHDYEQAQSFREAATMVSFADALAHVMFPNGHSGEHSREQLETSKILEDLNLYQDDLARLFERQDEITETLEAMV